LSFHTDAIDEGTLGITTNAVGRGKTKILKSCPKNFNPINFYFKECAWTINSNLAKWQYFNYQDRF